MSAHGAEFDSDNPHTWIEPPARADDSGEKANGGDYAPSDNEPGWPSPLGLAAFRGVAGDFITALLPETEADTAGLLFQFLAMFGNIIGAGPHYRVESTRHPGRLDVLLVGTTARGRKGTSFDRVIDLFAQVDSDWARSRVVTGLASGEGIIHAVRDPLMEWDKKAGEMVVTDEGIADKRLVAVASEFASLLKVMSRPGNTLSPLLRQAWDSGDLQNLNKNSPERATGAHLSLIGHITADELRRHLDETEYANGFANRLLFVAVKRAKLLPFGGTPIVWDNLAGRIRQIVQIVRSHGDTAIGFDAKAAEMWQAAYARLSDGRPGLFGAVTARAEAYVVRLALIYAALDAARSIGVPHLEAALECWRYAEQSARFIFGDALGDPIADTILAALRQQPDGMTGTDIRDLFHRHAKPAQLDRALQQLLKEGLATFTREETGGRPAIRWRAVKR